MVCISIVTLTIPICLYLYIQTPHLPRFCLHSPLSKAFLKLKPGLSPTCAKSTAKTQNTWLWPPMCCSRRWGILSSMWMAAPSSLSHLLGLLYQICFYLKTTSRLWPSPSDSVADDMIHVFIAFLGSCNGILFGLPNKALDRLQYVQDSAARVLTRSKPWTDITLTQKHLHWFPVESSIDHKLPYAPIKLTMT